MAEVVNLRTVRKQRRRAEGRAKGTEAAARSGESAAEGARRRGEAAHARRRLDGHRLDERPLVPEDGDEA